MLMRAYREGFSQDGGRSGLTQAGLLRRMSEVNAQYAERYSHVTVSRWESGTTLPTVDRLRDFGTALNLAPIEVEGLMILAGLQEDRAGNGMHAPDGWVRSRWVETAHLEQGVQAASAGEPPASSDNGRRHEDTAPDSLVPDMGSVVRYLAYKCVLMGVGIAVMGYALAAFGWNNSWMPVVYVASIMCLVVGQGLLYRRRPHDLGEFYSATVFFLLTTFLLQSSFIRMDPYGLYMVGDYAGTHIPYLLALEVNLALASIAGLAFHLLRQWHYSGDQRRSNSLRRAVAVTLPPTMFVYSSIVVISNIALWVQLVIVLPPLACVFMILLVLRDPAVQPTAHDRRLALGAAVPSLAIMGTVGATVVAAMYLAPNAPSVLPDHNWWTSWDIDFGELGYPGEEALERLNIGYLWHGLATFFYLVAVVGGVLISSLYRMGNGNASASETRSQTRLSYGAAASVRRIVSAIPAGRLAGKVDAGVLSLTAIGLSGASRLRRLTPGRKQAKSRLAAESGPP